MSKQGLHLGAGGWFISRMYRHSPSDLIIMWLRHHTHTVSLSRCGMWWIIRWGFCLTEGFVVAVVEGKAVVSLLVSCVLACSWPWSAAPQRRKEQPWHQEKQTLGWSGPPLDYSGRALFLRKTQTWITAMRWLNSKRPLCG